MTRPPAWLLAGTALLLFGVWSNSFVAIGYVLGSDAAPARLDWISLTAARFAPASLVCAAYCAVARRGEATAILRGHWRRLVVGGLLAVPGYNFALYYGQQHGVPAPVASLTTTLVPLFVMLLATLFLGERTTPRRLIGFGVAMAGMVLISRAKQGTGGTAYPVLVAVTALAPSCWSVYSVLSKPMAGRVSPVVWTYMTIAIGGLVTLPLIPAPAWRQVASLDAHGWGAALYLALPCTVMGYALWNWLLRFLPASTVGFTVFLNPPLTTTSKFLLAAWLPATFAFTIGPLEWAGGAVTLAGLALAVSERRARRQPVATSGRVS